MKVEPDLRAGCEVGLALRAGRSGIRRRPDWPARLWDFHARRFGRPFVWGENDCCLFAADWVLLATGVDPARELRGAYASPLGAARLARGFVGRDPADLFGAEQWPGWADLPEIPRARAQRGDVVSFVGDPRGYLALGVVAGPWAAAAGGYRIPRSAWRRAWRV